MFQQGERVFLGMVLKDDMVIDMGRTIAGTPTTIKGLIGQWSQPTADRFASVSEMRHALIPLLHACPDVPINPQLPRPAISSDPDAPTMPGSSAVEGAAPDHPTEPPRLRP